jgi:hypothetical protein
MINVWGDSIGACVVAHLSRKEVAELEKSELTQIITEENVNKAYENKEDEYEYNQEDNMNTTVL